MCCMLMIGVRVTSYYSGLTAERFLAGSYQYWLQDSLE
jgi:hypothetical protein